MKAIQTPQGKITLPVEIARFLSVIDDVSQHPPSSQSTLTAQSIVYEANSLGMSPEAVLAYGEAASIFAFCGEFENAVDAVISASSVHEQLLETKGELTTAMSLSLAAIDLLANTMPDISPLWYQRWTHHANIWFGTGCTLLQTMPSREIISNSNQIGILFDLFRAFFDNALLSYINEISTHIENLAIIRPARYHYAYLSLAALRSQEFRQISPHRQIQEQLKYIRIAVDSLTGAIAQEGLRYLAEQERIAINFDALQQEVRSLVGEVEIQLRLLVAQKYQERFGAKWLKHLETQHRAIYQQWMQQVLRNPVAYAAYQDGQVSILDYSLFKDLRDLILALWPSFRGIFDFGLGDQNQIIFGERMRSLLKVRNALAHQRSPQQTELMRSYVTSIEMLEMLQTKNTA